MSKFDKESLVVRIIQNKGGFAAAKLTEEMREHRAAIKDTMAFLGGDFEDTLTALQKILEDTVEKAANGDFILPVCDHIGKQALAESPDAADYPQFANAVNEIKIFSPASGPKDITKTAVSDYIDEANAAYDALEDAKRIIKTVKTVRGDLSRLSHDQLNKTTDLRETLGKAARALSGVVPPDAVEDMQKQTQLETFTTQFLLGPHDGIRAFHEFSMKALLKKDAERGRSGGM